ncbi:hypothetical protein P9139_16815 [Curtobacterium flaccumfaciens]|nr:hypothetical protein P9139_16815 [Curtobacterium flaccumfaciens]
MTLAADRPRAVPNSRERADERADVRVKRHTGPKIRTGSRPLSSRCGACCRSTGWW